MKYKGRVEEILEVVQAVEDLEALNWIVVGVVVEVIDAEE